MLDFSTRQEIACYLPHYPDPELDYGEYYFLQNTKSGSRVIKVFVRSIYPGRHNRKEYEIIQERKNDKWARIDARGDGDRDRGAYMAELYDNKEDCRNQTHMIADDWEKLRELQMKEEGKW